MDQLRSNSTAHEVVEIKSIVSNLDYIERMFCKMADMDHLGSLTADLLDLILNHEPTAEVVERYVQDTFKDHWNK